LAKTWAWPVAGTAVAAVLCLAMNSAPAHAQTSFQYVNQGSQLCLQEYGKTSAVYDGSCSANSSDYWYQNSNHNLVNAHSGYCLAVTGQDEGVYANSTCGSNDAEGWEIEDGIEIVNEHTGFCLFQEPGSANAVGQHNCSAGGNEFWLQSSGL
jgi:hypothetical protein